MITMKKRVQILIIAVFAVIISCAILLVFCSKKYPEREYHDSVRDIEEYIYDNTDRYVNSYKVSIDENNKTISWTMIVKESDCPVVIGEIQSLISYYGHSHEDCILNSGYRITITLMDGEKTLSSAETEQFAVIRNYIESENEEVLLDGMNYLFLNSNPNNTDYSVCYDCYNLEAVFIDPRNTSIDTVINMIDSIPTLEYIVMFDWEEEFATRLCESRPDITIVLI